LRVPIVGPRAALHPRRHAGRPRTRDELVHFL
jgi:hypothetical protein